MDLLIPTRVNDKAMEDAIDRYAEVEWKIAFQKAKERMSQRQKNINVEIKDEKKETAFGNLVAVMDYTEWCWLKEQYGDGIATDKEFLRDYKRFRDQLHLASV